MARIPDVTAIDRRIPTGQSAVAVENVSQAGAGFAVLSDALGSVRADIDAVQQYREQERERVTRYETQKAESDLLIQQSRLLQAASEDPDFETVEERTSKGVTDSLGESSMQINDLNARNEFIARNQVRIEDSRARAREIATAKKRDKERAYLNQKRDELREYGIASGDYQGAIGSLSALYEAGEENGHVSAVERQSIVDAAKHDFAKAHIKSIQDPEERIKALKDPLAKNIPADVRLELEQQAHADLRIGKAQNKADDWRARGLSFEQVQVEARKMTDPELREAAERRYDYLKSHDEVTRSNSQSDLYDEIDLRMDEEVVQTPDGPRPYSYDDIPKHEKEALSAGHRDNLKRKDAARYAPPTHSNGDAYNALLVAQRNVQETGSDNAKAAFRTLYGQMSGLLSIDDRKMFSKEVLTADGFLKPEYKDLWDADATLTKLIRDMKYDPATESALRSRLNEWYRSYQEVYVGKRPSAQDVTQEMNRLLTEHATKPANYLFTEDKRQFEVSQEEWQRMFEFHRQNDPQGMEDTLSYMTENGLPTSHDEVVVRYEHVKKLRDQEEQKKLEEERMRQLREQRAAE